MQEITDTAVFTVENLSITNFKMSHRVDNNWKMQAY